MLCHFLLAFSLVISVRAYCGNTPYSPGFSSVPRLAGPSTSTLPFLDADPEKIGRVASILTVGDSIARSSYNVGGKMNGLGILLDSPDDPLLDFYVSHSWGEEEGSDRAHGAKGSYISHFKARRDTLEVTHGSDLVQSQENIHLMTSGNKVFRHLSHGEVALPSAFQFGSLGTQARFYLAGEKEASNPRAFAFQLSGEHPGEAVELHTFGHFGFESLRASPQEMRKTVVAVTETAENAIPGGLVLFYVGEKKESTVEEELADFDLAGLLGGSISCLEFEGYEFETDSFPQSEFNVFLHSLDVTKPIEEIRADADAFSCTKFRRPGGGRWLPAEANRYRFVTAGSWVAGGEGEIPTDSHAWEVEFSVDGDGNLFTNDGEVVGKGRLVFASADQGVGRQLSDLDFDSKALYTYAVEGPLTSQSESSVLRNGPLGLSCLGSHNSPDSSHFGSILNLDSEIGPGWFLLTDNNKTAGGQLIMFYDNEGYFNADPVIFSVEPLTEDEFVVGDEVTLVCKGYDPNMVFEASSQTISFSWQFNDGEEDVEVEGDVVRHVFNSKGEYEILCHLEDSVGARTSVVYTLTVRGATTPFSPVPPPVSPGSSSVNKSVYGGIWLMGMSLLVVSLVGLVLVFAFYLLDGRTFLVV